MKHTKTPKNNKYGFSDYRLWPCYLVISGLILFLIPFIGKFWAIVIPFVIAITTSMAVVAYLEKNNKMTSYPNYDDLLKSLPAFLQESTYEDQPVVVPPTKQKRAKNPLVPAGTYSLN